MGKKKILLKITGELFLDKKTKTLSANTINTILKQIKKLYKEYQFGLVVGGGNFFRGHQHGKRMGIIPSVGHQIGMLGTMMNGLMLKDLLEKQGLKTALFCAMPSPEVGKPISQQAINASLSDGRTLIFTGGTGNPFFTTDTTAVLRALQIGADQIWKGTSVDGVYDKDPVTHKDAKLLKKVSFMQAMQDHLGIMDMTAYAMAYTYHQQIRIFDIFDKDALIQAAQNKNFGSTIS